MRKISRDHPSIHPHVRPNMCYKIHPEEEDEKEEKEEGARERWDVTSPAPFKNILGFIFSFALSLRKWNLKGPFFVHFGIVAKKKQTNNQKIFSIVLKGTSFKGRDCAGKKYSWTSPVTTAKNWTSSWILTLTPRPPPYFTLTLKLVASPMHSESRRDTVRRWPPEGSGGNVCLQIFNPNKVKPTAAEVTSSINFLFLKGFYFPQDWTPAPASTPDTPAALGATRLWNF